MNVTVITSDSRVWNFAEVCTTIATAIATKQDLVLDLNNEGPDFETLGLVELIDDYPTKVVHFRNTVQQNINNIIFDIGSSNWINSTRATLAEVTVNKNITTAFGMFIGRSNVHRLYLSSYLYSNTKSNQTFHCNPKEESHRHNIGLEELLEVYGRTDLDDVLNLIKNSPITKDKLTYPIYYTHHHNLYKEYNNFLVDIVCETYYNGNTFYPTEKTWRPIMLSTPFIVQGPQWYLHRLRDLGFQTFDRWWDEGYAEDPADHQPHEIVKVINQLKTKSITELSKMYTEMQPVLAHNKKRFLELKSKDFDKCRLVY
jgi:hypothetical protein